MISPMLNTYHCPKCSALLHATGSITMEGVACPVFQCDTCVVTKPIFGEPFEVAVTFAVNPQGQPFDPVDDTLL